MVVKKRSSGHPASLSATNRLSNSDMIKFIANKHKTTNCKADELIKDMFGFISSNVKSGKSYNQVGFGTFKSVNIKARKGYNPKTKVSIKIPSRIRFTFRAGASVKRLLNK